jgi:hypothetical protein
MVRHFAEEFNGEVMIYICFYVHFGICKIIVII